MNASLAPRRTADLGGVVGWQRRPVAGQGPVHRRVRHRCRLYVVDADTFEGGRLAVPPALPVAGECLGVCLHSVLGRAPPPIPTRPRDSRDLTEPGYGHARLPAEGVELVECPNSEPLFSTPAAPCEPRPKQCSAARSPRPAAAREQTAHPRRQPPAPAGRQRGTDRATSRPTPPRRALPACRLSDRDLAPQHNQNDPRLVLCGLRRMTAHQDPPPSQYQTMTCLKNRDTRQNFLGGAKESGFLVTVHRDSSSSTRRSISGGCGMSSAR